MTQKDLTVTAPGEIHALLGRGTEFDGKLTFDGRVRIDGKLRGEIFSDGMLIIGDGADVDAKIDVGILIVRGGVVAGSIRARELCELHIPAKVRCDIHTPQLFIDKGVTFEGRCTMDEAEVHPMDEPPAIDKPPAIDEPPPMDGATDA